jgi:hypothetical protein
VEAIIFISNEQYEELVDMNKNAKRLDERVMREFIVRPRYRQLGMGKQG